MLVFSIRDGLPVGIFLFSSYALRKMRKQTRRAKIRKLPASATNGLVTTICVRITGNDLAQQHSEVADLWIGLDKVDVSREHLDAEVLNRLCDWLWIFIKNLLKIIHFYAGLSEFWPCMSMDWDRIVMFCINNHLMLTRIKEGYCC